MLHPFIVNNRLGLRYRLCVPGEYLKSGNYFFKPVSLSHQIQAEQFLRNLTVSLSYWRNLVARLSLLSKPVGKNDAEIIRMAAQLAVSGSLRFYELPAEESTSPPPAVDSYKSNDGYKYYFQPASVLLSSNPEKIKQFPDVLVASNFVKQLNTEVEQLKKIATHLKIPVKTTSTSTDISSHITEALVSGHAIVVGEQILSAHAQKPFVEYIKAASRAFDLGPHETDGSVQSKTWFQIHLVDEIGEVIDGVDFILTVDGEQHTLTTSGGKVDLKNVPSRFAVAKIADLKQLSSKLETRWKKIREGELPSAKSMTVTPESSAGNALSLTGGVPHTVVLTPPKGVISLQLVNKIKQRPHSDCAYTIDGPMAFTGRTDDSGKIFHEEIHPGNYLLTLTLEFFKDTKHHIVEQYKASIVVIDNANASCQTRALGVSPYVGRVRVCGGLFDGNKSFLLPKAVKGLASIRDTFIENSPSQLLIVGHTQASSEPSISTPLSLERAEKIKAFIENDVDAWLKMYGESLPLGQRWGAREDRLMIQSLADFEVSQTRGDIVKWFQKTRSLTVDGISGEKTRTQLIGEYMALDGLHFSKRYKGSIEISVLGCGETFPLNTLDEQTNPSSETEIDNTLDSRIELFFFDHEFGIIPPATSSDGNEYLDWCGRAEDIQTVKVDAEKKTVMIIEFSDVNFATDREVLLPNPRYNEVDFSDAALTANDAIKLTLEYVNEQIVEKKPKQILLTGHTDTVGSEEDNLSLSQRRAENVFLYLSGKKAEWAAHSFKNAENAGYQQILTWLSRIKPWGCDPEGIDNEFGSKTKSAHKAFKQSYNAEFKGHLIEDEIKREEDWHAFFDMYDQVLANSMAVDTTELARLRGQLVFTSPNILACGEHQPIDQPGRDSFESKSNRRVDILFFDNDEVPDLGATPPGEDIYNSPNILPVPVPNLVPVVEAFFAVVPEGGTQAHSAFVLKGSKVTLHWTVKSTTKITITAFSLNGDERTIDLPNNGKIAMTDDAVDGEMPFTVNRNEILFLTARNEHGRTPFFQTIMLTALQDNNAKNNFIFGSDSITAGIDSNTD